jgi:hypothetical protein
MLKTSVTQEEMVFICEPEVGRNLSDEEERSVEDLIDFQREEFSGREMRRDQSRDLIDCQEGRGEISNFQEGNEKRSVEDIIDY